MKRGPTGRYESVGFGSERVQAFVPNPLPPEPPLEMSPSRHKLLERATAALGRLDSVSLLLPEPGIFLYSYVRREAVLSSQIEGTQSSFDQLVLFELEESPGVPFEDVVEVSNYVAALEHGLRRLEEGFPLSNRLIKEMHAVLLSSGRGHGKAPGEFRRSQNWIGGTRPGTAYFVPPPPHYVPECMSELERFLHDTPNPYPVVVKAALAHVQFETIHPFLDGNGRMGRLLIAFILHHDGILSRPLLYLSLFFKRHRETYYRLLDRVRIDGDWEAWVDFFLEGVATTAGNAVDTARRLVALFARDEQAIQSVGRSAPTTLQVFRAFKARPLRTLRHICDETGLSFPTAAKAVDRLAALGIVSEVSGRRRNRVFAYDRYIAILNEELDE